MEKFYLEKPSVDRKREIMEYINELAEYNSDTNGIGALSKIFEGYTFEQALQRCLNMENKDYAQKWGRCQSRTFLLIRENDNKIVGAINIRWNLSESMLQFGGHIGYGILPKYRGKGYAKKGLVLAIEKCKEIIKDNKINLYLGMLEAEKIGLDKVMLDCDVNNIGSDKTLKALGGKLERIEIDPSDGILTNVYWFDVKETIDKFKNIYEPYIISNERKKSK